MAGVAFFIQGTRIKLLMAARTLFVKSIGLLRHVFISAVSFMTVSTPLRLRIGFALLKLMVAFYARQTIACFRTVGLMIEKYFSCDGFKHDPSGLVRNLHRKRRVAHGAHKQ